MKLAFSGVALAVTLVVAELVVRQVAPRRVLDVGTTETDKATLYGWTAPPSEEMSFINPDTGESVPFRTNSQGWKDVEHAFAKPAGTVRILFLGDSFTWGYAPLEEIYPRVVERELGERGLGAEVISIGVGGWGTDQELEVLMHEGVRYEPDVVVYQFSQNDLLDNLLPDPRVSERGLNENYATKPFRYRVDADGTLTRTAVDGVEIERSFVDRLAQRSVLAHHLARLLGGDDEPAVEKQGEPASGASPESAPGEPTKEEKWQLFEALVKEMKGVATSCGARFVVFAHRTRPKLRGVCERAGIPLIEPRSEYERYETDPHTTSAGNRAMALDIVESLQEWEWFRALF